MKLLFLALLGFSLEINQKIQKQIIAKNSIFSLRVDDKFNELVLGARIITPEFLATNERGLVLTNHSEIGKEMKLEIIDLAIHKNILFVLEKKSVVTFDITLPSKPELLQRTYEQDLKTFESIIAEDLVIIYNYMSARVYFLEDRLYLTKIGEIISKETIKFVILKQGKICLFSITGIKTYEIIDYDLGYIKLTQFFDFYSYFKTYLKIIDVYSTNRRLFILSEERGLLEFSFFPISFENDLKKTGKKLRGFQDTLLVDGNQEINSVTGTVKFYKMNRTCAYAGIDSNFIYCSYYSSLVIHSRYLKISEVFIAGLITSLKIENNLLYLVSSNKVLVKQANLGPLFIEGRVPNSVSDYHVEFIAESLASNATEYFVLSVQYGFSDVVIFVLISFICVFLIIFSCSFVWKCFYEHRGKTEEKPLEPTHLPQPGVITEGQVASSSERNVISDRNLLRRK